MDILIITGFIGSGKTRLAQAMADHYAASGYPLLCLQTESGSTQISGHPLVTKPQGWLDGAELLGLVDTHKPEKLILELNGFDSLREWLHLLNALKKDHQCEWHIPQILMRITASRYDGLKSILGNLLEEQLLEADSIHVAGAVSQQLQSDLNRLDDGNRAIYFDMDDSQLIAQIDNVKPNLKTLIPSGLQPLLIAMALLLSVLGLNQTTGGVLLTSRMLYSFTGIVFQALPFLLIGVLLSSLISVFVSRELLLKYYPKNPIAAWLVSLFGGLLFPVCDCAVVPVATQLMRKGVPISAAFTFMLASPLLNPIAIASTIIAFPENPGIAVYRALAAIVIASISGWLLSFVIHERDLLPETANGKLCDCDYCMDAEESNPMPKRHQLAQHAANEFLSTLPYLVLGAMIAAVTQAKGTNYLLGTIAANPVSSLFLMIVFAFLLSVCSSSDAFIARGMVSQFSIQSVMGFLVVGALLDVKNTLMLKRSLPLAKLVQMMLIVLTVSFFTLYFGNMLAERII